MPWPDPWDTAPQKPQDARPGDILGPTDTPTVPTADVPAQPNNNRAGRQANRRVVLIVLA